MNIDFRTITLQTTSSSPVATGSVAFTQNVLDAWTALQSFQVNFGKDDHHVKAIEVDSSPSEQGNTVTVTARMEILDNSGNRGGGEATILVVARLA